MVVGKDDDAQFVTALKNEDRIESLLKRIKKAKKAGKSEKVDRLTAKLQAAQEASGKNEDVDNEKNEEQEEDADNTNLEVEGVIHDGVMYLVDKETLKVYAAERDDNGEMVQVGIWLNEKVALTKPQVCSSSSDSLAGSKRKRDDDGDDEQEEKGGDDSNVTNARARIPEPFGKWFPNATRVPGAVYPRGSTVTILLFYQYVEPQWSEKEYQDALDFAVRSGAEFNIGGRLRVAREGFNSTITGTAEGVRAFSEALRKFDPKHFSETDFKFLDGIPLGRAFKDLSILPVKELVYYGISAEQAPLSAGGVHLDAPDYHKKLQESNTVVVDVRNAYESDIGHFQPSGGAKLLDPQMRRSTEFPGWLRDPTTRRQLEGKQVLLYCTGGVRCERASALLKKEYGDSVDGVFQLQGGIERYMKQYPEGGLWQGKNFVFDKRDAVGAPCKDELMAPTVEGASATDGAKPAPSGDSKKEKKASKKQKKKQKKNGAGESGGSTMLPPEAPMSRCCVCAKPWDVYLGKKKCGGANCGVPVLVCSDCLQQVKKQGKNAVLRCTLCAAGVLPH